MARQIAASLTVQSPEAPSLLAPARDRILREARDQFVWRGFAAVRMQDVAEAIGLTKAAIYYHFSDKETLFEAVFEAETARNAAGIREQLHSTAVFREQLRRVAYFMLVTGGSSLGRLVTDLDRYVSDERRRALVDRIDHPYDVVRSAFEVAAARGELRSVDLDVVIPLYFSMIFGQIRRVAHGDTDTADDETVSEAIAALTIDGISSRAVATDMLKAE